MRKRSYKYLNWIFVRDKTFLTSEKNGIGNSMKREKKDENEM